MPFTFDFNNGANAESSFGTNISVSNTANGVTFTVSGDTAGGPERAFFGNGDFTFLPLQFSDSSTPDQLTLAFQSVANPTNTQISGTMMNPIRIEWGNVQGSYQIAFKTVSGTSAPTDPQYRILNNEDNMSATFVGSGVTGVIFSSLNPSSIDFLVVRSISGNDFNCFCSGTRISTPKGDVSVESLEAGDKVLTANGRTAEVKWLGRQEVNVRLGDPTKINPICITAGALGENMPKRDLWVSQDHAIGIDGYLVNAGALVNGATIYQVAQMPLEGFTYYHIETDAHELLLAEGCPAESFIDYAALDTFENADDRFEQVIEEMPLPRISAARMLPQKVRARIRTPKTKSAA